VPAVASSKHEFAFGKEGCQRLIKISKHKHNLHHWYSYPKRPIKVTLAKNVYEKQKLALLVTLVKNDQDQLKLSQLVTMIKFDQEKTKTFTVGILDQK